MHGRSHLGFTNVNTADGYRSTNTIIHVTNVYSKNCRCNLRNAAVLRAHDHLADFRCTVVIRMLMRVRIDTNRLAGLCSFTS